MGVSADRVEVFAGVIVYLSLEGGNSRRLGVTCSMIELEKKWCFIHIGGLVAFFILQRQHTYPSFEDSKSCIYSFSMFFLGGPSSEQARIFGSLPERESSGMRSAGVITD